MCSPRTGSATIWAACLPTAHPSVLKGLPPSACAASPGGAATPAFAPVTGLRNQLDVAGAVACAVSRESVSVSLAGVKVGTATVAVSVPTAGAGRPLPGWYSVVGCGVKA